MSDTLTHTSTAWAPWHAIPADRKWFARTATAAVRVNALIGIDPSYPGSMPSSAAPYEL